MTQPTYTQAFAIAIRAERETQQLYTEIAAMFAAYPPAVELWQALARDESYHASVLEQTLSAVSPERLDEAVESLLWEQATALQRLDHKALQASLQTLEDAYQLTHELEHSEINTLFEFLIHAFMSGTEIEAIALQQLREHLRRLIGAEESLGPAEVRQRVLAERDHG